MTGDARLDWQAEAAGLSVVPTELALVKAFLNSADIEEGSDTFATGKGVRTWLVERGLPITDAPHTERDRRDLVELREALRAIVAAHGGRVPSGALQTVAAAARTAELVVAIDPLGRADLQPVGHGVDALVARLLGDIASAQRTGTWRNLRICRRDVCRWAFYDSSRNHSGVWCTMSVCGNRVKSANLRRRSRTGLTRRPSPTSA